MIIEPRTICNEFGELKRVYSLLSRFEGESDMVTGIQLVFENGIIYHEALPDTDEVSCSSQLIDDHKKTVDISDDLPWEKAIGKCALWLWTMRNQQGYVDAIQYSFANNVEQQEVILQLMVIASEVRVYEIQNQL